VARCKVLCQPMKLEPNGAKCNEVESPHQLVIYKLVLAYTQPRTPAERHLARWPAQSAMPPLLSLPVVADRSKTPVRLRLTDGFCLHIDLVTGDLDACKLYSA
jgi:hypothetical protein